MRTVLLKSPHLMVGCCNLQAEAEYWKRSEGYRTGWSDEILGFDCGGEQWVLEVAFPTGTQKYVSGTHP